MATTSSRAIYRTRQVIHALWPRIDLRDLVYAHGLMTPAEARLFDAMPRRDQRHALEVMRRLREMTRPGGQGDAAAAETEGPTPDLTQQRDLLIAALLHDCGKGDVPVWLRIAHVLAPRFGRTAGKEGHSGWRGAAYRLHHHVELSVRLAHEAGASELTVRLVAGTPHEEEAHLAALLWAADDAS